MVLSSKTQYDSFAHLVGDQEGNTTLDQRQRFAQEAFLVTANYDTNIASYLKKTNGFMHETTLRYGENPHQEATFHGDLSEVFHKLAGKDLSYNNLLDVDAAVRLIQDFDPNTPMFAIIKHNNACGIAAGTSVLDAYEKALAADPVSAFGGVLITNHPLDDVTATKINELFFEILIAPEFSPEANHILTQKKNRILLQQNDSLPLQKAQEAY